MPWYIVLSGSVIIILAGIYKGLNIGLTMFLGTIGLGLLAGFTFYDFLYVFQTGLWNSITLMLVLSILLLGVLGHVLKKTGSLEKIIENLQAVISDARVIAATLPALIGMLTVPGGAILSAPLCAEAGNRLNLPPDRQAAVNIWFRHVLYFMLPLFPSLILAAQLSGLPMSRFVLHNLPLTLIGIIAGFFYLFRGYSAGRRSTRFSSSKACQLFISLSPLIVILALVVVFNIYFPLAIGLGILIALINYLPRKNRLTAFIKRLRTLILPGIKIPIAIVIAGIMIYKEALTYSEVIADLTNLVIGLGIPVIVLVASIPFLVGMLTGDNSASIALIFPMFMPLLPQEPMAFSAYLAFLYASSTAGHIISPAHPCFSLTKEYYQVHLKNVLLPMLPMLALIMIFSFVITALFGFY
jgi:hypothetical protein